jgi:hypothetical protein
VDTTDQMPRHHVVEFVAPDYPLPGRVSIGLLWTIVWCAIVYLPGWACGYTTQECTVCLMITSIIFVPFVLSYITIGGGTGERAKQS